MDARLHGYRGNNGKEPHVFHLPILPFRPGSHHTKAALVEFQEGLRVIIHSANADEVSMRILGCFSCCCSASCVSWHVLQTDGAAPLQSIRTSSQAIWWQDFKRCAHSVYGTAVYAQAAFHMHMHTHASTHMHAGRTATLEWTAPLALHWQTTWLGSSCPCQRPATRSSCASATTLTARAATSSPLSRAPTQVSF